MARLPKIDHLLKQNERITLIVRPLKRLEDVEKLLAVYMSRFRRPGSAFDALHPFDRGTLTVAMDVSGGRPGPILRLAHDLIEDGARNGWEKIGEREARAITQDIDLGDDAPKAPSRRRIGSVE